ncbi:MAG: hypothetical protein J6V20_08840 [Bacteroidaceae bacterium]|nr:hypothetical protein [Bacteroidaceae bacterium]
MKKFVLCAVITLAFCGFSNVANATVPTTKATTICVAEDEWDKILNEYEKYVDLYVKTYKKAMAGDMSALLEYAKLAEKAQALAEKIDKAKDEISESQLARYAKITQKMAEALQQ